MTFTNARYADAGNASILCDMGGQSLVIHVNSDDRYYNDLIASNIPIAEYQASPASIESVRVEAQRRIIELVGASDLSACFVKQLNANMRANELNDIRATRSWTNAEATEAAALRDLAGKIKKIRASSDLLVDPIPANYRSDAYWPVYTPPEPAPFDVGWGEQVFRLNSPLSGVNATGAQRILGKAVSLAANTVYDIELQFQLVKTAGTVSHTVGLSFGGTATLNNAQLAYYYVSAATAAATAGTATTLFPASTANVVLRAAATTAATSFRCRATGTISVNAAGTLIPQYTLSAAPGGAYATDAGSFMRIKPIGPAGANVSVGTWA